ncbi:MAG: DnaJ domain-containing protein [Nitrospirae bacterium]|nr:DnaJ domain-containing protein [Nitrospirota bacterium]MBF0533919.1 DnaJ domain-containing protein [Nitrospirota bacterium]MBF0618043.1 DnaJ domain-containing protein [Nitrospirota bacterium]
MDTHNSNSINKSLEVLGLNSKASPEEIKEAYKDLVKVWHPDRFAHDPKLQKKAGDKLSEINEAYRNLKDYDIKNETGQTEESVKASSEDTKTSEKKESVKDTQTKTQSQSKATNKSKPRAATRPIKRADMYVLEPQWARLLARLFDLYSLSMPCGFLAGAMIKNTFLDGYITQFFFTMLVITVMESFILATTGSTGGKYLLGIRVLNAEGKSLTFTEALSREFRVYAYGFVLGIPIVFLYTMAREYKLLKRKGAASWDSSLNLKVLYRRTNKRQIYIFLFLFVLIIAAYSYGFDMISR